MHTCPNCGFEIEDETIENCPNCAFNFNNLLSCPYKLSAHCVHTQKECYAEGLNYENCYIYLHKAGIQK